MILLQYKEDHWSPHNGAQVVFIGGGGGGSVQGRPKDRMLATLLSRDERDQLQAGL